MVSKIVTLTVFIFHKLSLPMKSTLRTLGYNLTWDKQIRIGFNHCQLLPLFLFMLMNTLYSSFMKPRGEKAMGLGIQLLASSMWWVNLYLKFLAWEAIAVAKSTKNIIFTSHSIFWTIWRERRVFQGHESDFSRISDLWFWILCILVKIKGHPLLNEVRTFSVFWLILSHNPFFHCWTWVALSWCPCL